MPPGFTIPASFVKHQYGVCFQMADKIHAEDPVKGVFFKWKPEDIPLDKSNPFLISLLSMPENGLFVKTRLQHQAR